MKTPTLNHNPQHTSPKPLPCRKPGNFGPCGGGREGGREAGREGGKKGVMEDCPGKGVAVSRRSPKFSTIIC